MASNPPGSCCLQTTLHGMYLNLNYNDDVISSLI